MDETYFQELMLAAEVRKIAVKLQQEKFVEVQQLMIAESGTDDMAQWLEDNPPETFTEQAFNEIANVRAKLEKAGHLKSKIQRQL